LQPPQEQKQIPRAGQKERPVRKQILRVWRKMTGLRDDKRLMGGQGVEGEVQVENVDAGFAEQSELALDRVAVD